MKSQKSSTQVMKWISYHIKQISLTEELSHEQAVKPFSKEIRFSQRSEMLVYTLESNALPRPLGKWIATTHPQHEWFYCEDADILIQRVDGGANVFGCRSTSLRTRSEHSYELLGPAPAVPDLSEYKPCLV